MPRYKSYTSPLMFTPAVRICLAAFTLDYAIMVGMTVTPFFVAKQLGGGAGMMGGFGAVGAAFYAGTALASAGFVSRAKNGLVWAVGGILVYAIFYGTMALFRDWRMCLFVSCIGSGALALAWPALHSWVGAESDTARRAHTMSWFNISWSFGFALSPLLAGPLYDANYLYPFVALAAICAISVALVQSLPHESAHFAAPTEELLLARADHDRASEMYLLPGWCATFIANFLSGEIRMVYPKRIDDLIASGNLRLLYEATPVHMVTTAPATNYSFLAFSFSLSTAITFLFLGRTNWWRHRFAFLFWMQVVSAVAIFALGKTHSLVIMCLCCAVIGSFLGLAFFSAAYYSLSNPERKHGRAAINEFAVGFGGFLGSLICGILAETFGITMPYLYTPALIVLGIAAQWALLKRAQLQDATR